MDAKGRSRADKPRPARSSEEEDLALIREMKKYADDGYDVELKRAGEGRYKVLTSKKRIVKAV